MYCRHKEVECKWAGECKMVGFPEWGEAPGIHTYTICYNDSIGRDVSKCKFNIVNMDLTVEVPAIKQLRKDIDDIIQRVKGLDPCRETSLAITKLQEGVMWLGMDLKRLNQDNPYPSSKDPSTGTKIEPTADGLKL